MAAVRSLLVVASALLCTGCNFHVKGIATPGAADLATYDLARPDLNGVDLAGRDLLLPPPSDLETGGSDAAPFDLYVADLPTFDMQPPDFATVAFLTGSLSTSVTSINLSTEGASDWIELGYTGAGDVEHKETGNSQIMVNGSTNVAQFKNYDSKFSWTDGTPTKSVSNSTTGVFVMGAAVGFTITAPASKTTHTLRLYINVAGGSAQLDAGLSDSSAPDYRDTESTSGQTTALITYTLKYAAASDGRSLHVSWTTTTDKTYASFVAATLQ